MNSNLSSDDDRQDVSIMTMQPINSKSDARRPISKTIQHNRKKIWKKLKVMMTDKVIITAKKEDKRFRSLIKIERKPHKRGDFGGLLPCLIFPDPSFQNLFRIKGLHHF